MHSKTAYEAVGGADAVLRLAHAGHERVMADEVVAHALQGGFHPQRTERLAAYRGEAWGGPPTYSHGARRAPGARGSMRSILVDAGPLIALFGQDDAHHEVIRELLRATVGRLMTTWPVITEASDMLDFEACAADRRPLPVGLGPGGRRRLRGGHEGRRRLLPGS